MNLSIQEYKIVFNVISDSRLLVTFCGMLECEELGINKDIYSLHVVSYDNRSFSIEEDLHHSHKSPLLRDLIEEEVSIACEELLLNPYFAENKAALLERKSYIYVESAYRQYDDICLEDLR